MTSPKTPTSLLASILSGALGADIKVIDLQVDPSKPIEDQLHAAAERIAAQHREECDGCRAKYEAEQLAQQHKAMAEQKMEAQAKHAAQFEGRITAAPKGFEAPYGVQGEKIAGTSIGAEPEYAVIGYMAFDGEEPLAGTFDTDRSVVEQGMNEFLTDPLVSLMNAVTRGKLGGNIKIRTLYARAGE